MPDSPEKAVRKQKRQARAQKAVTVASVVVPEAKAAKAGMAAKARTAKGAASAGEKGARKAANAKTRAPQKTSGKTASKPQAKTEPTAKPSEATKSGSRRAVQYTKREAGRRVQSVKTEQRKTSSAVRSKYRRDKVVGLAEMRPKTRMLAAEFLAAIIIAVIFLFVSDKSYHEKMSRFFVQLTGITGIFFFLALLGNSEKAGKWVIPFGLLIDVSMIGFLMRNHGGDVITRSLGGTPKSKPEPGGGPTSPGTPITPGGTGGPIHVVSASSYNAPHPGGSGIPAGTEPVWPGTGSPTQGGIVA